MRVCKLMLVHARLTRELECLIQAREHIHETLEMMKYARQLWQAFGVIVHQAIDSVQSVLGARTTVVIQAIDLKMEDFLEQILQLDPLTISQNHEMIGRSAS